MGEQDRALHEIADARARLSELADELARKAEPERLKAMAHDKAEELKGKAKEFALHKKDELKQHAKDAAVEKATELKTRTKETVMQRTMELKERADTPKGWSLLGALLGAGVGSALMRKAFTKREAHLAEDRYDTRYGRYRDDRWNEDDRWRYDSLRTPRSDVGYADRGYAGDRYTAAERTDVGYNSGSSFGGVSYDEVSSRNMGATDVDTGDTGGGMKARAAEGVQNVKDRASDAAHSVRDRASDAAHSVRDRAVDAKDRAVGAVDNLRERASHLRERIPERQVMQQRTTDWFNRTLEEQPLLLALGGIALGMVASTLMPVSNKERQLIEPAKRRAEESINQLGEQLNQKLGVNEQSSSGTEFRQDFSSASSMSATSDLTTPASTSSTGFGATSVGPGVTGTSYGATSATPTGAPVVDSSADTLASSTTGSSRIPPLPNLDDLTGKVH
ncbi:MAG TPA: hypothetical protein VE153_08570 [Myxococcus sp.]|nr:hypothetical protein [Myxococcus sp.]